VTAPLFALVALSKQSRVSFNDAHLIAGAHKEGEQVNGVSSARIGRFIKRTTNMGTIASKVSRTVGQGKEGCGFFTALGITVKGDKHGFEIANRDHPLVLAYCAALSKMTEGQFELLSRKGKAQ
jgi:hypothetical protein